MKLTALIIILVLAIMLYAKIKKQKHTKDTEINNNNNAESSAVSELGPLEKTKTSSWIWSERKGVYNLIPF